ncbi:MAG TPA: di-trans,poly-cis-decaprenylcistransferase [Candidatus Eisenbacteria bacterium]
MSQSASPPRAVPGLHVAIIMDGNGRWAESRGWPRVAGHRAGALAVRRIVEAARRRGDIGTLTLYAFSSDNWRRPAREVAALMRLFRQHLAAETPRCLANGIRLSVIGRRDRLAPRLVEVIEAAERATADRCLAGGRAAMQLRIAVDYSARDAIVRAATAPAAGALTRETFEERMGEVNHDPGRTPDVDLLVRSGGEQRLSDFLLWECAYAELHFTERMWPDFDAPDLERALAEFHRRQRRFGAVEPAAAPEPVVRTPRAS